MGPARPVYTLRRTPSVDGDRTTTGPTGLWALGLAALFAPPAFAQEDWTSSAEDAARALTVFVQDALTALAQTEAGATVLSPGLLVLETLFEPLGLNPADWLAAAFLMGWYFWLWLLRALYFSLGHWMGFASIRHYTAFTSLWPWEGAARSVFAIRLFLRQRLFGEGPSQRWATFFETAAYPFDAERGAVLVGKMPFWQRFRLHRPIGLPDGEKSVAYVSMAGGGKTAQLMTWLACLPRRGAALVYDMDGAMVDAFGAILERAGHKVVKLDVDSLAKGFARAGHWNPFAELTSVKDRLGANAVIAFAERMAHALIVPDSQTQPVFANQARIFVKALILWVWLMEDDKTLKRFRVLLNRGLEDLITDPEEDPFGRLLFEMSMLPVRYADGTLDDGCNGAMCEAIANAHGLIKSGSSGSGNSNDSFKNTAVYQTAWIDDDNVHAVTARSDMNCAELKLSNTVVFIVASLSDAQSRLGPLMRAFTMMTLYAFEKVEPKKKLKYPCLFLLDECPNVGRMDSLIKALAGFRKFGVRLVIATQSVGLMRQTYPDSYMEFFNQAQCVVWMGIAPTDTETLDRLVDILGHHQNKEKIDGWHWFARMCFFFLRLPPARYQLKDRALLERSQCAAYLQRGSGQIIVTREGGEPPLRLQQLAYWKDLAVWEYAPHAGHGEAFWRSRLRSLISEFVKKG